MCFKTDEFAARSSHRQEDGNSRKIHSALKPAADWHLAYLILTVIFEY